MVKFRFKMSELEQGGKEYKTDLEILRALVIERNSPLNMYSPLKKRLSKIYTKLDNWIKNNNMDL